MNQPSNLRRVFVVGCPRSGTTLLQSLLSANSRVASFPESHFFEKLFTEKWPLSSLGIASRRIRPRWNVIIDELGRPDVARFLPPYSIFVRQYTRAFVDVYDFLTLERSKNIWIEKTPGHLHYVEHINLLVPNAYFIHIIRDGAENIASLMDVGRRFAETWGPWYGTLDQCTNRWVGDVRRSLKCQDMPNHRVIYYDQLVHSPRECLVALCDFIGASFEEEMLSGHAESASQVILSQELWKINVLGSIKKPAESKFQTILTASERQYVREHIPQDLLSLAFPQEYAKGESCAF